MLNLAHLIACNELRDDIEDAFDLFLRAMESHFVFKLLGPASQSLLEGGDLVAILVLGLVIDFRIINKLFKVRNLALSFLLVDIKRRKLPPLRPLYFCLSFRS